MHIRMYMLLVLSWNLKGCTLLLKLKSFTIKVAFNVEIIERVRISELEAGLHMTFLSWQNLWTANWVKRDHILKSKYIISVSRHERRGYQKNKIKYTLNLRTAGEMRKADGRNQKEKHAVVKISLSS